MDASFFLSLKREQISDNLPIELRGKGLSMVPYLPPGCQVTLQKAPAASLIPGTLVALAGADCWTVHRLVSLEDGQVITKGDANTAADPPRPAADIVGRVEGARLGPFPWPVQGLSRLVKTLFGRTDPPQLQILSRYVYRAWRAQHRLREALRG